MADFILSQSDEITDRKLRDVADRVAKSLMLSAEKAVCHSAEPATWPIAPDPNSLEQIFLKRYKEFHPAKQQIALAKVMSRVKANPTNRSRYYKDLAGVDMRKAISIEKQVSALPFPVALKFPLNHLRSFSLDPDITLPPGQPSAPALQPATKLELRLHKVTCLDETNTWGTEWGQDEIHLGGTAVDETGDTHKIASFKVGDFDDRDVKAYSPPRQFTSFNLLEGTEFPKSYFVTFVLAEKDYGDLPDFLNSLVNQVKEKVIAEIIAATGGAIGASGGPIGAAIGAAVGYAVGKIFEFLQAVWDDEIFQPITVKISVPSLTYRFAGGKTDSTERIATFSGHGGKYQITYDWRMFA